MRHIGGFTKSVGGGTDCDEFRGLVDKLQAVLDNRAMTPVSSPQPVPASVVPSTPVSSPQPVPASGALSMPVSPQPAPVAASTPVSPPLAGQSPQRPSNVPQVTGIPPQGWLANMRGGAQELPRMTAIIDRAQKETNPDILRKMKEVITEDKKDRDNAAAAALAAVIEYIITEVRTSPIFSVIAAIASILILGGLIVVSIIFVILLFIGSTNTSYRKNPMNNEAVDYQIARTTSGGFDLRAKKYLVFVIGAPLVLLLAVGALYKDRANLKSELIIGILAVAIVFGIITTIFNYLLYFNGMRMLRMVRLRIQLYNTYIYNRMYKDSAEFLKTLTAVQPNNFAVNANLKDTIRQIQTKGITETALAKSIFTMNMYLHYQKLGMRNPALIDALNSFDPVNSMSKPSSFVPADYLFRNSTYIEDKSDLIMSAMNTVRTEDTSFTMPEPALLYKASLLTSEWVANANNMANSLYAEDAFGPYMKMAILTALVQIIPVIVLSWLFSKKKWRDALMRIIRKKEGVAVAVPAA